jgi:type II secretory pathway component PulK
MAAYFLPDTRASQVHTLSVAKATTSWTDKFTVSESNIKKVEDNQQQKANKPYSLGSYYFTLLANILQGNESRYNRASDISEPITIMTITELLC